MNRSEPFLCGRQSGDCHSRNLAPAGRDCHADDVWFPQLFLRGAAHRPDYRDGPLLAADVEVEIGEVLFSMSSSGPSCTTSNASWRSTNGLRMPSPKWCLKPTLSYYPTIALGNMVPLEFGLPNALGLPGPRADALLYPSVASKLRAMNVCMEPKTAVAACAPERAWTLQFEGVDSTPRRLPRRSG